MNRRSFFRTSLAPLAPALAQKRPRNVLFLIADDLGMQTGCYGDPTAVTPNIDKLAKDGVRFSHGFCTTASCSASRSVILSGLQNHANGQYGHAHGDANLSYLPKIRPFPSLLKDAGYKTGVIGKLHVNPVERFRWDMDAQGGGRAVFDMAEQAKTFIQGAGNQSWYLHVGFTDPHRDGTGFANKPYRGVTARKFDPNQVRLPSFLPNLPGVRAELAEYYQAANRLDQGVGFFMDVLRQTGQLDNTLVLFCSDNGMPFANAKTGCYDAGLHLPLIVRSPEQTRRGLVNNGMVSWVDFAPTILEWTGAPKPAYSLHGRSLLPILEEENPAGRDQIFFSHTFHEITMYYPMRGMRNRKFKYIRNLFPELEFPHASDLWASKTWQGILAEGEKAMIGHRPVGRYLHRDGEELYDVERDPDEIRNLAASDQHRETLLTMRQAVQDYRVKTGDPWIVLSKYKGELGMASQPSRKKK